MKCKALLLPITVASVALGTAACGGASAKVSSSSSTTAVPAARTASGEGPGNLPGASGTVAAVNGDTIEVQDPSTGQTTVVVTASTAITKTVPAAASDLAVGVCVTANGTKAASGGLNATAVDILATGTTCTRSGGEGFGGGFGGGRFRPGSAAGTGGATRPTLSPAQRARLANLAVAFGTVTSLSGNSAQLSTPAPPPTTNPTSSAGSVLPRRVFNLAHAFTWSSSTTFTKTEPGTASDITVGECLTAFGPVADNGAVTAQRVILRPALNGSCSSGFGRGFGRFGAGAGTGGGAGV